MKSQLIIVAVGVILLVWCGVGLGRWANAQVLESESRAAALVEVLK